MGELSNHNLPVGTKKGFFLPNKSRFLLLKPGSVFQSYMLQKGNYFGAICPNLPFRPWLGAGDLLLELTAQTPVTLWAGLATGQVCWQLGGFMRALSNPPDQSSS